MIQQNSNLANGEMVDAISRFLASPPEGTPNEIIEAFDMMGSRQFLPPKLFLETVEQAPVAISIADPNARILYVNTAFEELTGYARDEVIGKNESVLSSKSTPESVYQELWSTIKRAEVWQGKLVNHRKDKQEYLATLVISPVLNAKGKIAYFLGMHRDVTKLHRLEQQLKFQKELTEASLDAAPMAVALIGDDRKVLLDNHAYKALMGDFRGAEPANLILDALQQQLTIDLDKFCEIENFTNVDVRLDPPSGAQPRWFACSGVRLAELDEAARNYFSQAEDGRCCLMLLANEVTGSRKRINEARLNMMRAGMAEQQMMQTTREAISGAIFKLQLPLNIIRAALAMSDSDVVHLRKVMEQALDSGEEAMESLHLSLPKPSSEQHSVVNVNEVVHEVLNLSTDKLLASGVVVDWRPATVLPSFNGRTNALRGMFKYLIDNAITAVNEAEHGYREIRIETRLDDQELAIDVMDNGPGFAPSIRLKAFEPFYCGWAAAGEHAGMGLTMAQEVAISHGGNISVDPDFLGGCRVRVRLPLAMTRGGFIE